MALTMMMNRSAARRLDAVDGFVFPAGARHALGSRYPEFGPDELRLAEAATRQWFRLLARHPRADLAVPSVVVNELWHALLPHARDCAALTVALGRGSRRRPHDPFEPVPATHPAELLTTLRLAREDGGQGGGQPRGQGTADLPLLFRVDGALRVADGNRYLADCGGRGECFRAVGLTCLQHLSGPGRRPTRRGVRVVRSGYGRLTYSGATTGVLLGGVASVGEAASFGDAASSW